MRFICSHSVQVTEILVMLIFPGIGSGRACRVENVSLGSHGGSHKSQLKRYMEHCCIRRHNFFVVKKCGDSLICPCEVLFSQ